MSCMCKHDVDCDLVRKVEEAEAEATRLAAILVHEFVGCDTALEGEAHEGNHRTYCNLCDATQYGLPCGEFSALIHKEGCGILAAPQARELVEALRGLIDAARPFANTDQRPRSSTGSQDADILQDALAHPALKAFATTP